MKTFKYNGQLVLINEIVILRNALKAIYAALDQNATFPADVKYAKEIAKDALNQVQA